jgi:hypothetical protein
MRNLLKKILKYILINTIKTKIQAFSALII